MQSYQMSAEEFTRWMLRNQIDIHRASKVFGVHSVTVRYWSEGKRAVPKPVFKICAMISKYQGLIEEFENA